MARYKHQMVETDGPFDSSHKLIFGSQYQNYKCVFCDYTNHTMRKIYPYPEGWQLWGILDSPIHCSKSNVKIKWWERVIGNVNCRLVYCMNKKELKIQQALGIVNDRKERKKR